MKFLEKFDNYYKLDATIHPQFAELIRSYNIYFNERRVLFSTYKLMHNLSGTKNETNITWTTYFNKALDLLSKKLENIPYDRKRTYAIIFFSDSFSKLLTTLEQIAKEDNCHLALSIMAHYFICALTGIKNIFSIFITTKTSMHKNVKLNNNLREKCQSILVEIYQTNKESFYYWIKTENFISQSHIGIKLKNIATRLQSEDLSQEEFLEKIVSNKHNANFVKYCIGQHQHSSLEFILNANCNKAKRTIKKFMEEKIAEVRNQYLNKIEDIEMYAPGTVEHSLLMENFPLRYIIENKDTLHPKSQYAKILIAKINAYQITIDNYVGDLFSTLEKLKLKKFNNLSVNIKKQYGLQQWENADLSKLPIKKVEVLTCVIGDLHANAIKLIYFLITLKIADTNTYIYTKLYTAYINLNYDEFERHLNYLIPHESAQEIEIILIGDTLCDRGQSDYMVLLVYQWLNNHHISFNILLSNHDLEFLALYYKMQQITQFEIHAENRLFSKSNDYLKLTNLRKMTYNRIANDIYIPRLKLLEFLDNKPILLSHAPCDYKAIMQLYRVFNLPHTISPKIIRESDIEKLNKRIIEALDSRFIYDAEDIVSQFVWNRELNKKFSNYLNVFGHIGENNSLDGNEQINLDTNFGKVYKGSTGMIKIFVIRYVQRRSLLYQDGEVQNEKYMPINLNRLINYAAPNPNIIPSYSSWPPKTIIGFHNYLYLDNNVPRELRFLFSSDFHNSFKTPSPTNMTGPLWQHYSRKWADCIVDPAEDDITSLDSLTTLPKLELLISKFEQIIEEIVEMKLKQILQDAKANAIEEIKLYVIKKLQTKPFFKNDADEQQCQNIFYNRVKLLLKDKQIQQNSYLMQRLRNLNMVEV